AGDRRRTDWAGAVGAAGDAAQLGGVRFIEVDLGVGQAGFLVEVVIGGDGGGGRQGGGGEEGEVGAIGAYPSRAAAWRGVGSISPFGDFGRDARFPEVEARGGEVVHAGAVGGGAERAGYFGSDGGGGARHCAVAVEGAGFGGEGEGAVGAGGLEGPPSPLGFV